MMRTESYIPPTQDEIQRVGEYWQRVKQLTCEHDSIRVDGGQEGVFCGSDCGRPLIVLSDIQLEERIACAKRD